MKATKTEFKVVDSFLPTDYFLSLKNHFEGPDMPWYFMPTVADTYDTSDCYFTHTFFKGINTNSPLLNMVTPILDDIECKALLRVKANLYPAKEQIVEHAPHVDYDFSHKTMILYMNTNNGFTKLEDGTKIESVENRALFFDGGVSHNSSNCTDAPYRMILSINYF